MSFLNVLYLELKYRAQQVGKKPLCNLRKERALHLGILVFPLCYRCTGLVIGGVFAYFVNTNIIISFFLFIPMLIDSSFQYFTDYKSNNFKRMASGLMFGLGLNIFNF